MANPAPLAETSGKLWPIWAKVLVSAAIAWQIASLLAAELGQSPASPLEREVAQVFTGYYQATDQGLAHRFYSDIGPTPILLAELRFGDGRPNRTIRIPDRSARPRMVYQRQLALANAAFQEVQPSLGRPDFHPESVWARSFARYLCGRESGCAGVTIRLQMHRNPGPDQMIAAARAEGGKPLDVDSDEFLDTPVLLGDFPCETP